MQKEHLKQPSAGSSLLVLQKRDHACGVTLINITIYNG